LIIRASFGKKAHMQKPKTGKQPFFARFLERQELEKVTGGRTLKYPSDTDEWDDYRQPAGGNDSGSDD